MIRFGTSGWRAVISDEFTFANVRRVVRAIAQVAKESAGAAEKGLAVGYDTRFLSDEFAAETGRVLLSEGVPVHLATGCIPTPALAFAVQHHGLAGAINITASHNPPEYNGLKFSTADGAPAPPAITRLVESCVDGASDEPAEPGSARPRPLNPLPEYFRRLDHLVKSEILRVSGLKVAVDSRFGAARGWLDRYLEERGITVVRVNNRRDPLFGGGSPDCSGKNLAVLREMVRREVLDLGLATDGDGDRFGIVDRGGEEITPNLILALLTRHLASSRGWNEGVGRTVATTHLMDRVAARGGFEVHETPVGFKYLNPLLSTGRIFMGGEESAGLSVKGHVPEKDGILAALLVVEMVAAQEKSIGSLVDDLFREVGPLVSRRVDHHFSADRRADLEARLARPVQRLAGRAVVDTVRMDGTKWICQDGCWVLVRLSGTEPLVRIYAEAEDLATVDQLIDWAAGLIP